MLTKTETVRIEYSLPAGPRNSLQPWQQNEVTRFCDDRAHMDRMNRREMEGKVIRRRQAQVQ